MKKFNRILLTLGAFLLLFIFVWFSLANIKQSTLVRIKGSLQTVTKTTHEALHIWIKHRKNDVKEIAQDPAVIELTKELLAIHSEELPVFSSQPLQELRLIMKQKMATHNDIGFFIISPDYQNIGSMRNSNLDRENLIHQHRLDFMEQLFLGKTLFIPPIQSDVPLLTTTGELIDNLPSAFIGTPIKDTIGNVIAVLTIRLELSSDFTNITKLGRIGDSGETYAFDRNATMITNSRFDHQLQKIGLVQGRAHGMLSIKIVDPGGNMLEGFRPAISVDKLPLTYMAQQALSGKESDVLISYRDYRGVAVFGTWIWDKSLGFGLTTEIDVEEALIPYYNTRLSILLFSLLVIVLSIGAQLILMRFERQAQLELKMINDELELKVAERTKELEELSNKDGLTNIGNRRLFDFTLVQEWHRAMRHQHCLTLVLIDIDYFKQYNDYYGHVQGDACLVQVAELLSNSFKRTGDVVARYGGEEFAVLLPNISIEDGQILAQRYRQKVFQEKIPHAKSQIPELPYVTVSIGVASVTPKLNSNFELLIELADKNLYQAKSQGRNCVVSQ